MAGSLQLEIKKLRKEYPGVVALNDLSLSFKPGEVHAIVGENGAGKSTLIKCITGAISPTSGELVINGVSYDTMDPQLSKRLGIGVIYQEFNNVPTMSAAENVFLCEKTGKSKYVANTKEREKLASTLFRQLGVDIDPSEKVRDLSPAYQQIIEIARAVNQNVSFLIMDEPTAPLTVSEVQLLFRIIKDAIGGNREAAHLAGININRLHIAIYTIGGLLTSIASLLLLGRVGSGQPTAGSSYAFDCMSGAVLGGISIRGGEGSVIGAVLGIVIIGILDNGMLLMGMDPNWQDVIKGAVLILAVGLDGLQSMEKARKNAAKK